MPTSNSEMYDRGVRDAANDELNPFYYQHYYYYRKGYDDARRQLRRRQRRSSPLIALLTALLVLGGAGALYWYWWLGRQSSAPVAPVVTPLALAVPTPLPTRAPPTPTPPPTAAPSPDSLAIGARARVTNLGGAALRARAAPGLSSPVTARIPEGREVTVLEGPVEADGYVWWRVEAAEGAGWVAERSPEGTVFLSP